MAAKASGENGGGGIPELSLHPALLVDRSIAIYGPSGTGKTVCTKAIMRALDGHIEQVLIVAPTEPTNRSYDGFVDPTLIHYSLCLARDEGARGEPKKKQLTEKQKALNFLEEIWARQEMMASIYKRANKLKTLASLYERLPRQARHAGNAYVSGLQRKRERALAEIDKKWGKEPATREEKRHEAKEKFEKLLILIYKKFLTDHVAELWGRKDISEDERYSLAYLHFNPRLLLIFDDCAAQLKTLLATEIWRKLFYQNRHSYITLVLCCQDDTDLNTNLRKNAFISIFCSEIVCTSYFERTANKFPKRTRDYVSGASSKIFARKRQKIAYMREDAKGCHFYAFNPPTVKKQVFGSGALSELCSQVRASGTAMDQTNPYFSKFKL